MAKAHAKTTTLTETLRLAGESVMKSEIVKTPNGMLFKLFADVRNGNHRWNISVWSTSLNQWNTLATEEIIPNLKHLDYYMCYAPGSTSQPNPVIASNWNAMKEFIDIFCSNVECPAAASLDSDE